MKEWVAVVQICIHLFLVVTVCWFAFITARQLKRHHERLRILELKTGWLRVQEGPGKRVTVEGQLDAMCVQVQKVEDPPYAT